MKALFQKLLVGLAIMMVATPALALGAANTNMEILIEKIKADKKLLVGVNMSLTNEEARDFWPLYDAYQNELQTVNRELGRLIGEFAEAYAKGPIPNETASRSGMTSLLWKKRNCGSNGPMRIKWKKSSRPGKRPAICKLKVKFGR